MNSKELIQRAKTTFSELSHKGFDWRSFYNGFLLGYALGCGKQHKDKNDDSK